MSNYPSGVTGFEYAIAGADSEVEDGLCPECAAVAYRLTYHRETWRQCGACGWHGDYNDWDEV